MEEVTAGVCLVSIKRSRYSAVYGGGHAKTAFLHAAISAAAHQNFISFTNVQFGICYDERSELMGRSVIPDTRVLSVCAYELDIPGNRHIKCPKHGPKWVPDCRQCGRSLSVGRDDDEGQRNCDRVNK